MKKEVTCWQCHGTGKVEKEFCDICSEPNQCGYYEVKGKMLRICHLCWMGELTDEEVNSL